MSALISRIAKTLLSKWKVLPGAVKWAIEQVGGWAITEAISNGFNALVNYLSHLASWVINKIASLLGL